MMPMKKTNDTPRETPMNLILLNAVPTAMIREMTTTACTGDGIVKRALIQSNVINFYDTSNTSVMYLLINWFAIDGQRYELRLIQGQSAREMPEMHWGRVYVSGGDVIFPVENQRKVWGNRVEIITLPGGHYPFYVLDNWEKIWK